MENRLQGIEPSILFPVWWRTVAPSFPVPVSGWAQKQLIRLRSWRLPEHVGRYALYSISGGLCASGVVISVSGTRGLKCPLFYFRSLGAKMDLASSCTCGNGSRAWPNSQGDTCAEQTKECVWNGVLIRSQHSTAKPSVAHPLDGIRNKRTL